MPRLAAALDALRSPDIASNACLTNNRPDPLSVLIPIALIAGIVLAARAAWRRFRARLTANTAILNETLPVHSRGGATTRSSRASCSTWRWATVRRRASARPAPTTATSACSPATSAPSTGRSVRVVNLSVSGATVELAVRDQLPKFAKFRPDVVTVSIGANDIAKDRGTPRRSSAASARSSRCCRRTRSWPTCRSSTSRTTSARCRARTASCAAWPTSSGLTVVPLHTSHATAGRPRACSPTSPTTCSTRTTTATGSGPTRSARRCSPPSTRGSRRNGATPPTPATPADAPADVGGRRVVSRHGPAHHHVPLHRMRMEHREVGRPVRRVPAVGHRRRRGRADRHRRARSRRSRRAPHVQQGPIGEVDTEDALRTGRAASASSTACSAAASSRARRSCSPASRASASRRCCSRWRRASPRPGRACST